MAYEVEPGSIGNQLDVLLDDRAGLTGGLRLEAEVLSQPTWLEVTTADVEGGRQATLSLAFDVAHVAFGSKGIVKVRVRGLDSVGSEVFSADHGISLFVDADVEDVQRSFGIDECCVEVVGVEDLATPPSTATLVGNTPNPFRALTHVVFGLPVEGGVARLDVYDIQGRLLRSLSTPRLSGGFHRITWDGRDEFGRELSAGTYFYRVSSGTWVETRKLQILE
jgi:hypothetical protein